MKYQTDLTVFVLFALFLLVALCLLEGSDPLLKRESGIKHQRTVQLGIYTGSSKESLQKATPEAPVKKEVRPVPQKQAVPKQAARTVPEESIDTQPTRKIRKPAKQEPAERVHVADTTQNTAAEKKNTGRELRKSEKEASPTVKKRPQISEINSSKEAFASFQPPKHPSLETLQKEPEQKPDINRLVQDFLSMVDVSDYYPNSARRRRQQGVTVVQLVLNENPKIADIRVFKSSRHRSLDRAALELVRDHQGELESELKQKNVLLSRSLKLNLPIHFRLE